MSCPSPDRRALGAWLAVAAAGLTRHAAWGQVNPVHHASRLPQEQDTENLTYEPPATVGMIQELARRMTVPVLLDGKGPFRFIIDTGANQSVVSRELAEQLGLAWRTSGEVHGVAGAVSAPTVRVGELRADRFVRRDVTLSALPAAALGAPGVLGLDGMTGVCLTLDYPFVELRITPSARAPRESDEAVFKAVKRDGQLTLISASLSGRRRLSAFLDTGAETSIGNRALQRLAGLTPAPGPRPDDTPIFSITGQTLMAQRGELSDLQLGGFTFHRLGVLFADVHTFDLWGLNHEPTIMLGVDVLTRFRRVALDFGRSEVRFVAP